MRINFGDLRIGDTARNRIERALSRGWVSEGDNVREFESKYAVKFGHKHAIATTSGTDALICGCAALYDFGAQRGDEIILPAVTFTSSANAVLAAGFVPRFVDIEVETLNIDPGKIEQAITEKTRAIMVVHLMGKPCAMDQIQGIAQAHGLKVLEDCCEAHGAQYKGKTVGNIGDLGHFSFYVAHLIVSGEGGMVTTDSDELADIVRSVRNQGRPPGSQYFDFQRMGFNCRMSELEAAIGLDGLENFDETFKKRKENIYMLLRLVDNLSKYCFFIKEEPHEVVSPHAFPMVLRDKGLDCSRLYRYLNGSGIETKPLFGCLPTQHGAFKFLGYNYGDFPAAEYVGENGMHFGIHQYLSDEDLLYIAETLEEYFN